MDLRTSLDDPLVKTILDVVHIFPWQGSVVPYASARDFEPTFYSERSVRKLGKSNFYRSLFVYVGERGGELLEAYVAQLPRGEDITQEYLLEQFSSYSRPRQVVTAAINNLQDDFDITRRSGVVVITPRPMRVAELLCFNDHAARKIFNARFSDFIPSILLDVQV
jgi:hypothetical protein